VLELDASGQLIQMTPTGGETGARNITLPILLGLAIRTITPPLKLFDSSTGSACPMARYSARMPCNPAPQDGHLPGQRRPAELPADS
jgi:Uma2 family endonuclease